MRIMLTYFQRLSLAFSPLSRQNSQNRDDRWPSLSSVLAEEFKLKLKLVLAAMLEGNSMPSNMAANTNHTTLLKNQSAIKYLP